MMIGSMATIKARMSTLPRVVAALLTQLDHLYIYANDYRPELSGTNISVLTAPYGDLGDRGKWVLPIAPKAADTRLLLDDDFIYPPDYVRTMARHVETYPGAVVGLHGVTLHHRIESYYRSRTVLHWRHGLELRKAVHILGTGCVAFRCGLVGMPIEYLESPNMADIWLGLWCQEWKIPMVCVPHPGCWLEYMPYNDTLYQRGRKDDSIQTAAVKRIEWRIS